AAAPERFEKDEVLVALPGAQAQYLERTRREERGKLAGAPGDERTRPNVVAVLAVAAQLKPGPDRQREPIEELLGKAACPERRNEFVCKLALRDQNRDGDHCSIGAPSAD